MPVLCAAHHADPQLFLRVAAQGARLATHEDLWRWLRGELQSLLPHELFLSAWGNFREGDVHIDLVSSLPGLRTRQVQGAGFMPLVRYLRDCWAVAQYTPCRVEVNGCASLGCMRSGLVHGTQEAVPAVERIFAALSWRPDASEDQAQVLAMLVPFIDTALRRLAPLPLPRPACPPVPEPPRRTAAGHPLERLAPPAGVLSERERQIMAWVAMGKTNPEIGCILRISEFTVKNHMKSIFSKLDVSNRAQAVATLTRLAVHA